MELEDNLIDTNENDINCISYEYEDFLLNDSIDNSFVELYYKSNLIYYQELDETYSYNTYYIPHGRYEYYIHKDSNKSTLLYVSKDNIESEDELTEGLYTSNDNAKNKIKKYFSILKYKLKTKAILISENDIINPSYKDKSAEFKKLQKRYEKLKFVIPYFDAKSTLSDLQGFLKNYIINGNLDILTLKDIYSSLSISPCCPNSSDLLKKFIDDPNSIDIRDLFDQINLYSKNISNIIDLNTKDAEFKHFD